MIKGWLFITLAKDFIVFMPEDRHSDHGDRFPWQALVADETILEDFLRTFEPQEEVGPPGLMAYSCAIQASALTEWFEDRICIIEVGD